jgi:thioredoxin-dependent peroxiredoxin
MKRLIKILVLMSLNLIFMINVIGQKKQDEIKLGSDVPVFSLPDQDGKIFNLKDYTGKKNLVIYFYPKDDTPGCTKEACSFRDQYRDFVDNNAMVIGISAQNPESHRKFISKYNLNFTLLCDEDGKVKNMFGAKNSLGGLLPARITYVVNKQGKIIYIFSSQTEPAKHVDEALRILKEAH